jgi:hypothetical protein
MPQIFKFNFSNQGKGMRDTRAREEAALARLNQSYGFLLNNGITEGNATNEEILRFSDRNNLIFNSLCRRILALIHSDGSSSAYI